MNSRHGAGRRERVTEIPPSLNDVFPLAPPPKKSGVIPSGVRAAG